MTSGRPRVVGEQPLHPGDAVDGEVPDRTGQEGRAGRALLVGQHLGVGEPEVVIDQGVQVVVADRLLVRPGRVV